MSGMEFTGSCRERGRVMRWRCWRFSRLLRDSRHRKFNPLRGFAGFLLEDKMLSTEMCCRTAQCIMPAASAVSGVRTNSFAASLLKKPPNGTDRAIHLLLKHALRRCGRRATTSGGGDGGRAFLGRRWFGFGGGGGFGRSVALGL